MKKYNVNVNGTAYEVTVEEVVGGAGPGACCSACSGSSARTRSRLRPPAPAAAPAPAGSEEVRCPMPGTILSVNVNPGDTVAGRPDPDDPRSDEDGERDHGAEGRPCVVSVSVQKGASVESGTLLCVIG